MTRTLVGLTVLLLVWLSPGVILAQEREASGAEGQRLFTIQGCYGCHTIGKFGTPIGPDLSRIGFKYSKAYLTRWLSDPESQRPNAHMPKLELDPAQVNALAAFLATLR